MRESLKDGWSELLRRMEALASGWAAQRAHLQRREDLVRLLHAEARARNREVEAEREALRQRSEKARRTREALLERRAQYLRAIEKLDGRLKRCESFLERAPALQRELEERETRLLETIRTEFGQLESAVASDAEAVDAPQGPRAPARTNGRSPPVESLPPGAPADPRPEEVRPLPEDPPETTASPDADDEVKHPEWDNHPEDPAVNGEDEAGPMALPSGPVDAQPISDGADAYDPENRPLSLDELLGGVIDRKA
ncbi:MAG: hypothetical protein ACE5IM_10355 [Nitrospinota bacterium]